MSNVENPDLVFDPEQVLPASHPKPLNKIVRILDEYLPGFFEGSKPLTGVEIPSFHFVKGTLHGVAKKPLIYVHAKKSGQNPAIHDADSLSIVSGICLFGKAGLTCFGPHGEPTSLDRPGVVADSDTPIVRAIKRADQQIYVPESIARLGRTMIALQQVAACRHNKAANIFIHLPGPEYKIMAEAAYAAGRITLDALQAYYALVDNEVAEIRARFSAMFTTAGLRVPEFGSPLDDSIAPIRPGSLRPDHFKNTVFESFAHDMTTMKAVGHASEVVAYTKSVRPGNLPIFIDNHREERIFKFAKEEQGFRGIALYPLPLCVDTQSHNLFRSGSASEVQITRATKPWL